MRRDVIAAIVSTIVFTVLCGLAYPLLITGLAQGIFHGHAKGSRVEHNGNFVGSKLVGQSFHGNPHYFQSRPSATNYAANATAASSAGPNSRLLSQTISQRARAYLAMEGPDNPGLTLKDIPVDAVTASGSGIDPHISVANARLQAGRIARLHGVPRSAIDRFIKQNTSGRSLGFFGESAVNVLTANLAIYRLEGQ
jgi:potassium-transporting ATPase KdpC subunit